MTQLRELVKRLVCRQTLIHFSEFQGGSSAALGAGTVVASALSSVGIAGTAGQAESAERFRLSYIVAAAMYGNMPLATVLDEVKKTGTNAIDIWSKPHGTHRAEIEQMGVERAAELFKEHGVEWGVSTRYDLQAGKLSDEIATLGRFKGKLIITGAKKQSGATVKEQVRNCVESFKPDVAKAAEQGITIGLENHAGMVLSTPDAIRYFAEYVDFPHFGFALAPYHLPQDAKEIAALIDDVGDKLVFFQAWQYGKGCMEKLPKEDEMLQLPGKGDLDFGPILGALKKANYRGYTEVFMHPVPRGVPIRETSEEVTAEINRSRDYLEQRVAAIAAS